MMNAMGSNRSTQGWKRRSSLGAVLVAASAWLSGSAWAAAASDLTVTLVDTQPDPEVSVSRAGLAANIVYRIRMQNTGGNTVNQVVFTGTSDVGAYSDFVNIGAANPNCPAPSSPVNLNIHSVTCQVGQLKAGDSVEFFLMFQTPTTGTSITFNGKTDFSEGASSGTKPANFTENIGPKIVNLITTDSPGVNKHVKTVLPPAGGVFFTGPNGQVSSGNQWSTIVRVPSTSDITVNQITLPTDAPVSHQCSTTPAGAYFCFGLKSTIDVLKAIDGLRLFLDDTGSSVLVITLRQDASSLSVMNPIPKIGTIKIFYNPDSLSTDIGIQVPDCGPGLPIANNPCIAGRTDNLKGNKGYYEWTIWAKDNGSYNW